MSAAMTIAQIMGTSAGGVGRHVAAISADLRAAGHEVKLWAPAGTDAVASLDPELITISTRPRPVLDIRAMATIRRLASDVNVIHAHGLRAAALTVLALTAMRSRPKVVATLHNLPVGSAFVRGMSAALERIVARGCDTVLGVSKDLVQLMQSRGARNCAVALVPAPARAAASSSAAEVRAALGLGEQDLLLITVARLAIQKGLNIWVDAIADAYADPRWPKGLQVCAAIAGDGPLLEELTSQVQARKAPVHLLGFRSDIADLLDAADLVVVPSIWEGQPLAVQEAIIHGCAVVATDAGGTADVTGPAAYLVPAGDRHALAEAIVDLANDPPAVELLRAKARQRATEFPTAQDTVTQLQEIYRT